MTVALIIEFCFPSLVAAVDTEVGVTGVRPIMEAVMTTTIAVAMVGTGTEVETTVILIKAAPTDPVGTTTITTDVEAVVEAAGVAAVATMEVAVGVAAEAVTTIMAMMMTASIGMAKRINFQIIWNTFPRKMTPWLPEPCSPEISNLISLTRKSNAFLADMAICSTLTSNVRPQVNIFQMREINIRKSSMLLMEDKSISFF